MNTTDRVVKVLEDAAKLLSRDGWCQNYYHDEAGHHCAVGAINAAIQGGEGLGLRNEALRALKESLRNRSGVVIGVARWNDTPGRTADEVVREMRAAAESLRADS